MSHEDDQMMREKYEHELQMAAYQNSYMRVLYKNTKGRESNETGVPFT
jgi:hypothetical protein